MRARLSSEPVRAHKGAQGARPCPAMQVPSPVAGAQPLAVAPAAVLYRRRFSRGGDSNTSPEVDLPLIFNPLDDRSDSHGNNS